MKKTHGSSTCAYVGCKKKFEKTSKAQRFCPNGGKCRAAQYNIDHPRASRRVIKAIIKLTLKEMQNETHP